MFLSLGTKKEDQRRKQASSAVISSVMISMGTRKAGLRKGPAFSETSISSTMMNRAIKQGDPKNRREFSVIDIHNITELIALLTLTPRLTDVVPVKSVREQFLSPVVPTQQEEIHPQARRIQWPNLVEDSARVHV